MSGQRNIDEPATPRIEPAGLAGYRKSLLANAHWLVTIACLCVTVALFLWARRTEGPRIVIRFEQGHGLKAADRLQHRGIDVGEVIAVRLNDDFDGVEVEVALAASASGLAREKSLFWIERPQIGLGRVRGLETIVGAKYLGVLPGPATGPAQYEFQGEEHPLSVQGSQLRQIVVRFQHGNGLVVGDALRHRGIQVGEVIAVDLNPDLSHVEVKVRLEGYASRLARAGSRFWIERPQVSLSGVRSLETVVSGRYLSVLPGPPHADNLDLFDGLEDPPTAHADGLEIVLESPHRFGVEVGAPVTYRGMQVGSVAAVRLGPDAGQVETLAHIDRDYRSLVCEGSRFWSTGGIGINLGITGFELNAESLQTIAAGGVGFATPNEPGIAVSTGYRFKLERKGDPSWLTWTPRIAAGPGRQLDGAALPEPRTLAVNWQVKQLAWRRQRQLNGLVLLLEDGRWLGPKDLLSPPSDTLPGTARFEFDGNDYPFDPERLQSSEDLAFYRADGNAISGRGWPLEKIRVPGPPEDSLIVPGVGSRAITLPSTRLTLDGDVSWNIDASFTIAPQWHGASIVAVSDGKLVAVLEINAEDGNARAVFVK
jgi:paraquat-inducible protein B